MIGHIIHPQLRNFKILQITKGQLRAGMPHDLLNYGIA